MAEHGEVAARVYAQIRGIWKTQAQIRHATGLKPDEISRRLANGVRGGWVESEMIPNPEPRGHRMVYRYRLLREPGPSGRANRAWKEALFT